MIILEIKPTENITNILIILVKLNIFFNFCIIKYCKSHNIILDYKELDKPI